MTDPALSPDHYKAGRFPIECHEIVRYYGFDLGNAIKYLWRRNGKGTHDQDVGKARVYLEWARDTELPLYLLHDSNERAALVFEQVVPHLSGDDPLDLALFAALEGRPTSAVHCIDTWSAART